MHDDDDYEDDYDDVDDNDLCVEVCRPSWVRLEHADYDDHNDDCDCDDCNNYLNDMSVNFSAHHPVSYFPELFAINLIITL